MADNEIRLVSRAIRDRNLIPVLNRGIDASWFHNPEAREIWNVALDHWSKYGEVPTAVTVKDVLPGVNLLKVDDTIDYLVDQFIAYHRRGETLTLVQQAAQAMEQEDYEGALAAMRRGLAEIETVGGDKSRDLNLVETIDERIDEYVALKTLDNGMRGIPTGFPTIDKATSGLQPGQLVTIVATPKCGKSTLMLAIAKNIHAANFATSLVTFEMSNPEQAARYDAMLAGISHTHLTTGTMSEKDERLLRRNLNYIRDMKPFVLVNDPIAAGTVSGIRARAEQHKPDVLFIDGVYLMIDEVSGEQNTPQALTNITRNLKRLAQSLQIPVVISTQALTWKTSKKKGVTSDSIGYSSSFFQDSDVLLGLQYTDEDEDETERLLKVMESRNCGRVETTVNWDWSRSDFSEVEY